MVHAAKAVGAFAGTILDASGTVALNDVAQFFRPSPEGLIIPVGYGTFVDGVLI